MRTSPILTIAIPTIAIPTIAALTLATLTLAALTFATAGPLLAADAKPLFNGKNLDGWSRLQRHENAGPDRAPGFKIEGGMLISDPDAPEDDIWYTREKIGNATIRVVYKVDTANAN